MCITIVYGTCNCVNHMNSPHLQFFLKLMSVRILSLSSLYSVSSMVPLKFCVKFLFPLFKLVYQLCAHGYFGVWPWIPHVSLWSLSFQLQWLVSCGHATLKGLSGGSLRDACFPILMRYAHIRSCSSSYVWFPYAFLLVAHRSDQLLKTCDHQCYCYYPQNCPCFVAWW